jgi:SAM-dependent methyltransferase
MAYSLAFENYIKNIDFPKFLQSLKVPNAKLIIKEVEHFTEKEAGKRDQIVLNYFGEYGIKRIIKSVVEYLLSPPKLKIDARILDVGAGSGLFTIEVAEEVQRYLPKASFYAMDITPAMLSILVRKTSKIIPFLGIAENIAGSIEYARKYLEIPKRFDTIFSILMLHYCSDIERVFGNIRDVLEDHGKVIIIDLCEHSFEEFRKEMGDVHLGFSPLLIKKNARRFFPNVYVKRMPGISCECSGRSAELFIAYLTCK